MHKMSAVVVYVTAGRPSLNTYEQRNRSEPQENPFLFIINRGSLSEPGICKNIVFRATIGHMSECPRNGILMVQVCFLS